MHNLLSILIWLPIAVGVAVMLLGDRNIIVGRWLALIGSLVTLALAVPLWAHFNTSTADLQFRELLPWIPRFQASYGLGVDGISMPLSYSPRS
jgi:NADH-quinone oxidoreductase subunit M